MVQVSTFDYHLSTQFSSIQFSELNLLVDKIIHCFPKVAAYLLCLCSHCCTIILKSLFPSIVSSFFIHVAKTVILRFSFVIASFQFRMTYIKRKIFFPDVFILSFCVSSTNIKSRRSVATSRISTVLRGKKNIERLPSKDRYTTSLMVHLD